MANFTEYFSKYLETHDVPSSLDKMPLDENGKTFKQRFIERNYYKEIGSETEELFTMHLAIKCDECVEDYYWRIQLFSENYSKLMDRFVSVHNEIKDTNSGTDSSNDTAKHYLNPVDNQSDKLSDKDSVDRKVIYGKTIKKVEDLQHAVSWARSNPEIMKAALDLEDIYTKALASLDCLFMVVL